MSWCRTCRRSTFALHGTHQCPPAWRLWFPDETEANAGLTYGDTATNAVESWAMQYDADNSYGIVRGGDKVVLLRKVGTDAVHRVSVEGRSEPVYRAMVLGKRVHEEERRRTKDSRGCRCCGGEREHAAECPFVNVKPMSEEELEDAP